MTRIQYASQNNSDVNVSFKIGDSSSEFLQRSKMFYNVHFSNFSFQWLSPEKKKEFGQVAFDSLKQGGIIAIQSNEGESEMLIQAEKLILNYESCKENNLIGRSLQFYISKSETEAMITQCGFKILSSEYHPVKYRYASIRDFVKFLVTADYEDRESVSLIGLTKFTELFGNDDGSLDYVEPTVYQIVAQKI